MKNYLIKSRYNFNNKIFCFVNKLINKKKNVFFSTINIKNIFIYKIKIKKNFFLIKNFFINFKILIIFGGDGSVINELKNFFNKKIFTKFINSGNLGFLTNNNLKKNFIIKKYLGNLKIFYKKKIIFSLIFINEVLLKNNKLKLNIKNFTFYSDFIIISTSQGSTGYNFSLNKIHFEIKYFLISLVCSHTNYNILFFSKKIKLLIKKKILLIIDYTDFFYLKNKKIFFFLFINNKNLNFLNKKYVD